MTEFPVITDIVASDKRLRCAIEQGLKRLGPCSRGRRLRVFEKWSRVCGKRGVPVICVSWLDEIDGKYVDHVRALKNRRREFLLFLGRLPCEAIPERLARLNVRDPSRIHVAQSGRDMNAVNAMIERLVSALASKEEQKGILDAWWEDEVLVVISPSFQRIRVRLEKLRPLRALKTGSLERFEIDEDGSFLYWPAADVHMGWDELAQSADENAYIRARQESKQFNREYGAAIRRLRRELGLRQTDVKGLSSRQVRRVEEGKCRATSSALAKLAKAHGMGISTYLSELAKRLPPRAED